MNWNVWLKVLSKLLQEGCHPNVSRSNFSDNDSKLHNFTFYCIKAFREVFAEYEAFIKKILNISQYYDCCSKQVIPVRSFILLALYRKATAFDKQYEQLETTEHWEVNLGHVGGSNLYVSFRLGERILSFERIIVERCVKTCHVCFLSCLLQRKISTLVISTRWCVCPG